MATPSEPPGTLVVDAANTVGSRPDGWWRDRPGATARLHRRLLAAGLGPVVLVVEGQARRGVAAGGEAVRCVHAPGSGDDTVVAEVERLVTTGAPVTVVTGDRGLRERVAAAGAAVVGTGWLLDRLPADTGPSAEQTMPSRRSADPHDPA